MSEFDHGQDEGAHPGELDPPVPVGRCLECGARIHDGDVCSPCSACFTLHGLRS